MSAVETLPLEKRRGREQTAQRRPPYIPEGSVLLSVNRVRIVDIIKAYIPRVTRNTPTVRRERQRNELLIKRVNAAVVLRSKRRVILLQAELTMLPSDISAALPLFLLMVTNALLSAHKYT